MNNNVSDIEIPTDEQYEEAKARVSNIEAWLSFGRERQSQLIDELCRERETEKIYLLELERNEKLIYIYELYDKLDRKVNL